jgi:hypothetical protein
MAEFAEGSFQPTAKDIDDYPSELKGCVFFGV